MQVAAAQCLLVLGSFFSLATLGDCAFVQVDENLRFPLTVDKTSNTFGFLTFEDAFGGRCYWYDDSGISVRDQLELYWDFLGADFRLSRIFAAIAAGGGWLQFFYSFTFCCSSQVRSIRYFLFFLVSIVLTLFQGLSLVLFSGDFCKENECVFGRAAGFACAACGCYFAAGIMYCFMSDYPGARLTDSRIAEEREEDAIDEEQQSTTSGKYLTEEQADSYSVDQGEDDAEVAGSRFTPSAPAQQHDDQSDSTPITRVTQSHQLEEKHETPSEPEVEEVEVVEEEVLPDDEEEEEVIEEEIVEDDDAAPKTAEDVVADDESNDDPIFVEEEN